MNVWTALGLAPASISREAKVCRHSCSVIGASGLGSRPADSASSHSWALKLPQARLARLSMVEATKRLDSSGRTRGRHRSCRCAASLLPVVTPEFASAPRRGVFCWDRLSRGECTAQASPVQAAFGPCEESNAPVNAPVRRPFSRRSNPDRAVESSTAPQESEPDRLNPASDADRSRGEPCPGREPSHRRP
jgi:hypothetical protein